LKRGEIWLVSLDDGKGHEQKGDRPAIILGGANNLHTVIPLTTNITLASFSHTHILEPTKENGLDQDSVAMVHQIVSIDKGRFKHKIGVLSDSDLKGISVLLNTLLFG
jgi:mRNA interferase MazF